jgi:hypothetical protein
MAKPMRWVTLMLVLAAAWLTAPAVKAAPADDFLNRAPALRQFVTNLRDVSTPQGGPWSATGHLFGVEASLYLYWPQGTTTPPVAVVPLPGSLTLEQLFPSAAGLNIGLKNPLLFLIPPGVSELKKQAMPNAVAAAAQTIKLPDTVQVIPGFNLLGSMASPPFLAKLLTDVKFPNPNNLTAGIARGTDSLVFSLSQATWQNPFGLADTSITGATIKITKSTKKDDPSQTIETWGSARVDNHKKHGDFAAYLKRDDALNQSVGFNTKKASLGDFFLVAGAVSNTLGLPAIPWPSQLPLDKVVLENPKYTAPHDASPPDLNTWMFEGGKENGKLAELTLNAAINAFGWQMAKTQVNASSTGIVGAADFLGGSKIGTIDVPSASFYLRASAAEQAMGINANASVFGRLDLKAGPAGLKLVVPPSCPLRPVGFTADVTNLGSDFPITPTFDDCFSGELKKLADGAADAYKDTEQFTVNLAEDAAGTADALGTEAVSAVGKLHLERTTAWAGTLASHAVTLKTVKDAAAAAGAAVDAINGTIRTLGGTIKSLNHDIDKLAGEIKHLLEQIWGAVTGELKEKKKAKERKVSARDDAITQKAAAEARLTHAEKNKAAANQAISKIPSPYLTGPVAELQAPLLGAQAQSLVQPRVASMMRDLPAQLKDPAKRKEILGADKNLPQAIVDALKANYASPSKYHILSVDNVPPAIADANKASNASTPPKMSDLYSQDGTDRGKDWLGDAKKSLVSQAIAAKASAATDTLLRETVATLPTMTYDQEVNVVLASEPAMCMGRGQTVELSRCNGSGFQKFTFQVDGAVFLGTWAYSKTVQGCIYLDGYKSEITAEGRKCPGSAGYIPPQSFFFDPIDGLIRYLSPDMTTPLCLLVERGRVVGGACPAPNENADAARWSLVGSAKSAAGVAATRNKAAARLTVPGMVFPRAPTNLAPLQLK